MALVPDLEHIGRWVSDTPAKAGVHAIVIGISEYPYLQGGSAKELAPNNGGLGQLEVSATTAAKVFEWINQAGEVAGAQLATCRLLLAPRPTERNAVDLLTQNHYAVPDFSTIRSAVDGWADDIFVGSNEPESNVAFFFFSGHGVEILASPALLASDILNPRSAAGANKAIAIEALARAVKTCGIDRGLFFVDACRDAPTIAKTLNMTGEEILSPNPEPRKIPDALISLLSTRSGSRSYQAPGDSATIFGQALLEALEGPPPSHVPYDTTDVPWKLLFKNLECHVKQRVRELLSGHSALKVQPVEPYGNPYNSEMLVAHKRGPLVGSESFGPPPAGPQLPLPPPTTPPPGAQLEALIAERAGELLKDSETLDSDTLGSLRSSASQSGSFQGDLLDWNVMHGVLGHEFLTEPWLHSVRLLNPVNGEPASPDSVQVFAGRRQTVGTSLTVWMDVLVKSGAGEKLWISVEGERSHAIVIPRDQKYAVPVRIDLEFQITGSNEGVLQFMSARLADPKNHFDGDVTRVWRSLWDVQRLEAFFDLGRAGMAVKDLRVLEEALLLKGESPVGAAIATTILLRCGALEFLHDWPRNLAERFAWLPDGPVLWAETLLNRYEKRANEHAVPQHVGDLVRQRAGNDTEFILERAKQPEYEEARQFFSKLADRGPPLLAASLAMAARQVPFWRQVMKAGIPSASESYMLAEACEFVERAASSAASGGVFAAFTSPDSQIKPATVLGAQRAKAKAA